jgi:hypothetical protein
VQNIEVELDVKKCDFDYGREDVKMHLGVYSARKRER